MADSSVGRDSEADSGQAKDRRRMRRELLLFVVAAVAIVGARTYLILLASDESVHDDYRHYLVGVAEAAAQQVDPSAQALLRQPAQQNTPEYERAVAALRRIVQAVPEVRSMHTIVRDADRIRCVLDTTESGDSDGDGVKDQLQIWDICDATDPAAWVALGNGVVAGRATATAVLYTDKRGPHLTGWAPILDAGGRQIGALGVDVGAREYFARRSAARNGALRGFAPVATLLVLLAIITWWFRKRGLAAIRSAVEAAANAELAGRVLARERQRLRSVVDATKVGTWEWDIGSDRLLVGHRWAAMIGYGVDELPLLSHKRFATMLHPEDVAGMQTALESSIAGPDTSYDADFRVRHAAGHWVWIGAHGNVVARDAEGRALRMAGVHIDISVQKQTALSLLASERKFRSLFDLSPVGIALNDLRTGQFLEVNDALVGSTGYSREELLRLTYWDMTPTSYAAQEQAQLDSMERTGAYGPYEKEFLHKDTSRYPVLLAGTRMTDASGREVIWSIVQDISKRKAAEQKLAAAAWRDGLTGLANRALFMERLQQAVVRVRHGEQPMFAVLFLDCDRFKLVNDALGHEAGDELLRQIAARLRGALRASDAGGEAGEGNLVARFGGDEFLVLINDLHAGADATRIAERLLNTLAPAYSIRGQEVHSTASVGIVTSEECLESAEAVVRNADLAMYEAKRSGRGCSVVFNESMHVRLTRNVTIESGLRRALGTPQLMLVYQPIVELQTGAMVSAEALLRWNHPELGLVPPAEFIPVAEDSGLIGAIGQWVLQEACRTLVDWRRRDPTRAPETISVNISRAELALGEQLLARVRETLEQTGLPAHCLQLEVTEREVMHNPSASQALMRALQAIGVRLAMDDFGSGTSSLGCLRDYPFDTIKIDRSFVCDLVSSPDLLAVMHATITLVENLGKASVAEGVEDASQLAILQSLGCRYAQGYFFSRPVPAEKLLGALAARTAALSLIRTGS
jgi:diguanylate cyclase (GGDEF)-like protein/PAS domain S-box-containing protein